MHTRTQTGTRIFNHRSVSRVSFIFAFALPMNKQHEKKQRVFFALSTPLQMIQAAWEESPQRIQPDPTLNGVWEIKCAPHGYDSLSDNISIIIICICILIYLCTTYHTTRSKLSSDIHHYHCCLLTAVISHLDIIIYLFIYQLHSTVQLIGAFDLYIYIYEYMLLLSLLLRICSQWTLNLKCKFSRYRLWAWIMMIIICK